MYRSGRGASPDGVFPFLDKCPVNGGSCQRIGAARRYERFALLNDDAKRFLTQYEDSQTPRNLKYTTPNVLPLRR